MGMQVHVCARMCVCVHTCVCTRTPLSLCASARGPVAVKTSRGRANCPGLGLQPKKPQPSPCVQRRDTAASCFPFWKGSSGMTSACGLCAAWGQPEPPHPSPKPRGLSQPDPPSQLGVPRGDNRHGDRAGLTPETCSSFTCLLLLLWGFWCSKSFSSKDFAAGGEKLAEPPARNAASGQRNGISQVLGMEHPRCWEPNQDISKPTGTLFPQFKARETFFGKSSHPSLAPW